MVILHLQLITQLHYYHPYIQIPNGNSTTLNKMQCYTSMSNAIEN